MEHCFDKMDARDEAYDAQFEEHRGKQQLARDMDEARAEAASIAARAHGGSESESRGSSESKAV